MSKKEKNDEKISFWQIFKRLPRLYPFMKHYKLLILATVFFTMFGQLLIAIPPMLIQYGIDSVVPTKDLYSLNIIFLYILAIYLSRAGLVLSQIYCRWYLGLHISYDIRKKLFDSIMLQSPQFFAKRVSGEITSRLNNDVGSMEFLIANAIFDIASSFLQIAISLGFLFYLSTKLTVVTLILTLLQFIAVTIVMNYFKKYQKQLSERWGKMLGYLQEMISNVKIVTAFGNQNRESVNFIKRSRDLMKINIKLGMTGRSFGIVATIFWNLFFLGVVIYGIYLIPKNEITLGILFAYIMYIRNFFDPIFELSGTVTYALGAFISVDRIYEYIETPSEIQNIEKPLPLPNQKEDLIFENVSFRYEKDKEKYILNNLSLTIKHGQSVAFVGPSGAGKSTIINLVLRFYDPEKGCVKYGGTDLRKVDFNQYRERVAIVFQDALLFNDTIINNLKYAKQNATYEEVVQACKDANIYDFVMDLPQKFETLIGERGLKLSGGQRQRLSIARSLLKNPEILILDEATSAIDSISENIIQESLNTIMKNRTSIVIAHRLSTIVGVDKIFVLKEGQLEEEGNHEELIAKNGLYAGLWNAQIKEEK